MLNKFQITKACIPGMRTTPQRGHSCEYSAFVKIYVHAYPFTPEYSFAHHTGNSKLHVAKAIMSEFTARVDEVASSLDDEVRMVRDIAAEQKELSEHFTACLEKLRDLQTYSWTPLRDMETECAVGHFSLDLTILAAGAWDAFNKDALNALEDDVDFATFLEVGEPRDDDEEQDYLSPGQREVYNQFINLRGMDPEERSPEVVSAFLERLSQVIHSDDM